MAKAQDTFTTYRGVGYPGQVSTTDVVDVESYAVETAALPFGFPVMRGTAVNSCQPATSGMTAAAIIGFSVRSMAVENNASGAAEYAVGDTASVLRRGKMYATCSNGATAGATVHIVKASGVLRGSADTTNTIELNQVKWMNAVGAGEIGEIVLDGILATA